MADAVADPPAAFELTTPAEPAAVARIRSAVRQFAAAHGADQHVLVSIALAVSEAATNAVLHAFVGREPGVIRTVASAGPDEMIIRIVDNGRGMQPRTDSPGLGIGLPTMSQMSASLDIRPAAGGGTDVCMTFDVPGADGEPELRVTGDRTRLRVEVHRLEHILGALAEGVIVHDAGGQIVYANAAAVRVLRADDPGEVVASAPGELSGRFRFLGEDGSLLAREDLPGQRLVAGRAAPPLLMRSVHIASGQERWLLTRGSILDEDGPLAVNIIEDVTETKVAEHRHAFIVEASRLLASPGEPQLQRLAELAVEHIADWCAIDLDGRRVASAVRRDDLEPAAGAVVAEPIGARGTLTLAAGAIARSLDAGDREFIADVATRVDAAL
jgi:anti-sigma regulatory factor (Ser/Thr protein kinase)